MGNARGGRPVAKLRDYLRISDAAEYLGVSPNTLRNWERAGKIAAHRHPVNRYRLFKQEDLDAVLQEVERPHGERRIDPRKGRTLVDEEIAWNPLVGTSSRPRVRVGAAWSGLHPNGPARPRSVPGVVQLRVPDQRRGNLRGRCSRPDQTGVLARRDEGVGGPHLGRFRHVDPLAGREDPLGRQPGPARQPQSEGALLPVEVPTRTQQDSCAVARRAGVPVGGRPPVRPHRPRSQPCLAERPPCGRPSPRAKRHPRCPHQPRRAGDRREPAFHHRHSGGQGPVPSDGTGGYPPLAAVSAGRRLRAK